jgi:hypothetical protein
LKLGHISMNQFGILCWFRTRWKKILLSCMFISSTPISSGLRSSPAVDRQSLCHPQFYIFYWHSSSLLYRFVVCFLVCHVCLRVTMTSLTQGKKNGYLSRALIWLGHFFVYHICKKVRISTNIWLLWIFTCYGGRNCILLRLTIK